MGTSVRSRDIQEQTSVRMGAKMVKFIPTTRHTQAKGNMYPCQKLDEATGPKKKMEIYVHGWELTGHGTGSFNIFQIARKLLSGPDGMWSSSPKFAVDDDCFAQSIVPDKYAPRTASGNGQASLHKVLFPLIQPDREFLSMECFRMVVRWSKSGA